MSRFRFLAALALAGIGKAQFCTSRGVDSLCPVRNNECPVCGEMAPGYKRQLRKTGFLENCQPDKENPYLAVCAEQTVMYGESERLIRCRKCNAAFWQDAERESLPC